MAKWEVGRLPGLWQGSPSGTVVRKLPAPNRCSCVRQLCRDCRLQHAVSIISRAVGSSCNACLLWLLLRAEP